MPCLAITYRAVLDGLTADRTLVLRAFELDDEEWAILRKLAWVLKVCSHMLYPRWQSLILHVQVLKDATMLFSCSTPSLADVIPGMDYLDEFFATVIADNTVSLAVRAAVGLGKRHLNKYYGLTDPFPAC